MKSILDHALNYLSQGIAVIPSNPKTKAPLVKWVEFQQRLPTKDEVISMFKQFPKCMISCVTGRISNLVVIDADSEEAVKKIEENLPDSFETVIDISPRGGRHYWFQMNSFEYQSKSGIFEKCDIKCNGGVLCVPPSVNDTGGQYRFLNHLDFRRELLNTMPDSLSKMLASLPTVPNTSQYSINNNKLPLSLYNILINKNATFVPKALELFKEGKRNANLFPLALCLKEAHRTPEYILQVLVNIVPTMASTAEGLKELIGIIDSAFKHEERKERSLAEEIKAWVMSTSGTFMSTDIHRDLDLSTRVHNNSDMSTRVHKKNCSEILRRLIEEGIIERHGHKNGCFRKLEKQIEYMDYVNVSKVSVDIQMPLLLHQVCNLTPKAIVVVAGATNAGKTSFFLNLVKMNMDRFDKFYYFNSETSPESFRKRLDNFGEPISFWTDKLKVIERSNNFADLIQPNGINIIDYLELDAEKLYAVGGVIKDIFNKLDKGIAFIGIQKAANAKFGRGGEFTLEKAQLAIALDYNKATISKCKSPVSGFDYHEAVMDFDIKQQGSIMIPTSGWKRE